MRYNKLILPIVLGLFVFPLATARNAAAQPIATGPPSPAGVQGVAVQPQAFRILFSDGSLLNGAMSFTMNLDTQYGRLTVPSANLISAHFNSDGWADIVTNGVQMHVQYSPATSNLAVVTDAGPLDVSLSKVVTVDTLNSQAQNPTVPAVTTPYYDEGNQVAAPSVIYPEAAVVETTPDQCIAPSYAYCPPYYAYCPYPFFSTCGYPFYFTSPLFCDVGFDRDFNFNHGHFERFDHFGVASSGFDGDHRFSAAGAFRQFNGTAGLQTVERPFSSASFRTVAPSFSAAASFRSYSATPSFRSYSAAPSYRSYSAAPSYRSYSAAPSVRSYSAAPSFRSFSAAPSFRSAPSFSGGSFARSSSFGGFARGGGSGGFAGGGGFGGRR